MADHHHLRAYNHQLRDNEEFICITQVKRKVAKNRGMKCQGEWNVKLNEI